MLAERPPSLEPAQLPAPRQAEEYKPSLAGLRKMLEDFQSLTEEGRKESEIDEDYKNGVQWTAEERRILRSRKQPDNVFNRVRPAVNGTLGVIKQGTTDPRAYPRTPDDQDSADVASKALRYAADTARFDKIKVEVADNYLTQGTGACIIEVDEDRNVIPRKIRWEEFIYDPRSREMDFSDARYMGMAKWMYADDVKADHQDKADVVDAAIDSGGMLPFDEGLRDRPRDGPIVWADRKARRLLVVELYYREGQNWRRCVFCGSGILEEGPSPYLDHKKRPMNPIEAESCFIDRDNNRYGIVRDMRGPQDEINKRRSKLLHIINTRQVQEAQFGALAGADVDLVRKEAARPDGVLPSGAQVVPTTDMAAGQAQLLQYSTAEIERMGPNPAILGRQGESQSGRASLVRQQAGLTEQAVIFGGIEDWELRVYRQMWARMKQFWTAPMWIRVTDDQKAPEFVGINQPQYGQPQPITVYNDQTGQQEIQYHQPILGYENALAEMDVDIIVDTVPDTANVQQETFLALVDLAKAGVPIPPQVLLEIAPIQDKAKIMELMKSMAEQPNPQAEEAAALAKAKAEADIVATTAKAQKDHASALETMVKADNLTKPDPDALATLAGAQQANTLGTIAA